MFYYSTIQINQKTSSIYNYNFALFSPGFPTVFFHLRRTRSSTHPHDMAESPTRSPSSSTPTTSLSPLPEIPIEIISDDEMALIEAAFASARAVIPLTLPSRNVRSINSITLLSKRRLSGDIEDLSLRTRRKGVESLYDKYRKHTGLFITDLTAAEWCEKQNQLTLIHKPKKTEAMKKGTARHVALEEEVIKRTKIHVASREDRWAVKIMNFIQGANQLLFDGMTRELPLLSFEEGVWLVGVIDEIRMPALGSDRYPTIVDTKTRVRAMLPSGPQQRNGRLQLMCYKRIWDNLVAGKFPVGKFYDSFSLNPNNLLSTEIRESTAKSGYPAETLNDLVGYFRNTCSMLPPSDDQLLLRYELQEDQSLIGEDHFPYYGDWLDFQLKRSLEFWLGKREPSYAPDEERWKCKFCSFSSDCPAVANNANLEPESSKPEDINVVVSSVSSPSSPKPQILNLNNVNANNADIELEFSKPEQINVVVSSVSSPSSPKPQTRIMSMPNNADLELESSKAKAD